MANTRSFKPKASDAPSKEEDVAPEAVKTEEVVVTAPLVNEPKSPEVPVESAPENRAPSSYSENRPSSGYSENRGYRSDQPRDNYREQGSYSRNDQSSYPRNEGSSYSRNDQSSYTPRTESRDVPTVDVSGFLDIMPEGHGFLRPKYTPSDRDVYISASQIRRFNLRPGDFVEGGAREPKENERYFGLLQVSKVNDKDAETMVTENGANRNRNKRVRFEDLTAIYPNRHLKLETGKEPLSQRVIDLIAPIGFGQRGLVVSPPKAGKTTILKELAAGITKNHPDAILMAVLVGERPEEVTDLSRSIKGDVIASNFDEPAENQTRAAEVALERAKRLVEEGKDVIILLDSITRLGRAYNLAVPPSGRTLSGGFDPVALYPPKHFFGAARNCEEGGSLTIIGTALVDTGSRMDELIYEEFKGTGNMELHLDRRLSERRIFPSINVEASGTRQEQLLFDEKNYEKIKTMHRMLRLLNADEQTERLLDQLARAKTNDDFLASLGVVQ